MPEWLVIAGACAGQIFTAGAIYGAIRSDIRGAIKDAEHAKESATEAHLRIDAILMRG